MGCAKCGAFRRCEGGLHLGGTVAVSVGPPCPCLELPRLRVGTAQEFGPWVLAIDSPSVASVFMPLRFCAPADASYDVGILDVTFDSGFPAGATLAASVSFQAYHDDLCEWDSGYGYLAAAVWFPPADPLDGTLIVDISTGRKFIALALVTVISPDGFTEMPVARLSTLIDV